MARRAPLKGMTPRRLKAVGLKTAELKAVDSKAHGCPRCRKMPGNGVAHEFGLACSVVASRQETNGKCPRSRKMPGHGVAQESGLTCSVVASRQKTNGKGHVINATCLRISIRKLKTTRQKHWSGDVGNGHVCGQLIYICIREEGILYSCCEVPLAYDYM